MQHVKMTAMSVIENLKQYPISRGLVLTQVNKHKEVEDFRCAPLCRHVTTTHAGAHPSCRFQESDLPHGLQPPSVAKAVANRPSQHVLLGTSVPCGRLCCNKESKCSILWTWHQLINTLRQNISELHQPTNYKFRRRAQLRYGIFVYVDGGWPTNSHAFRYPAKTHFHPRLAEGVKAAALPRAGALLLIMGFEAIVELSLVDCPPLLKLALVSQR